jgi:NTP pyrophosphatase (non-canonical NTP hydrolase)
MDYAECVERSREQLETRWDNELHMVLGMVTEAGELADAYKKALAYGKLLDDVNIREELGDILWYIQGMCNINGWTIDQIIDINVQKLIARYPQEFTTENAINRDLENERETIEQTIENDQSGR